MEFVRSVLEIVLMLFGFGMLIFVHELGHFLAAKWAGIRTEGFAVGMGPHVLSWRKGIGFCLGSSEKRRQAIVAKHMSENPASYDQRTLSQLSYEEYGRAADDAGLGETEYSLRWLPIGGFVKMLGQDDTDPNATSIDPRSYNMRPIGKRMVVVSAGVIMNIIFAAILFIIAFMAGVQFPAPVVGDVGDSMPAGKAIARNAAELGLSGADAHIMPGDRITHVNGDEADTFADVELASAFSKNGEAIELRLKRDGIDGTLIFDIVPVHSDQTGLRAIGLSRGASVTLREKPEAQIIEQLELLGLAQQGVRPGMEILTLNGEAVDTFEQVRHAARLGEGEPLEMTWGQRDPKTGELTESRLTTTLEPEPLLSGVTAIRGGEPALAIDETLIGLSPAVAIADVAKDSPNVDRLRPDDVFLRIGRLESPTMSEFLEFVSSSPSQTVDAVILRDGRELAVPVEISRQAKIGIYPYSAVFLPRIAGTIEAVQVRLEDNTTTVRDMPVRDAAIPRGSVMLGVNDRDVHDWEDLRAALRAETATAHASDESATITLRYQPATDPDVIETAAVTLSPEDVRELHALQWRIPVSSTLFEDQYVTRSAGGNPIRALAMGVEETHMMIMMTYMTIDRLFRRTVGIEQLHGPVGIIHLGTRIMDRGAMYLIFFLAAISVNLAVINFLPLPIVDGGLFLFLVYEKFKGRPPSAGFQNAAMIVGLVMLAALFLITFYNDVMRIIGG